MTYRGLGKDGGIYPIQSSTIELLFLKLGCVFQSTLTRFVSKFKFLIGDYYLNISIIMITMKQIVESIKNTSKDILKEENEQAI